MEVLSSRHAFKKNYDQAVAKGQVMPQAMCISSFCKKTQEVDSRFVNLKFIDNSFMDTT